MNQQRYIVFAVLILFVATVIYFSIKKFTVGKDIKTPQTIIDYEKQTDTLPRNQLDGKMLFYRSCAPCHSIFKDLTGPALVGINERWPDKKKLYEFIKRPFPFFKKDSYVKKLVAKYGVLTPGFDIKDDEIDAIFRYIEMESKKKVLPTQ